MSTGHAYPWTATYAESVSFDVAAPMSDVVFTPAFRRRFRFAKLFNDRGVFLKARSGSSPIDHVLARPGRYLATEGSTRPVDLGPQTYGRGWTHFDVAYRVQLRTAVTGWIDRNVLGGLGIDMAAASYEGWSPDVIETEAIQRRILPYPFGAVKVYSLRQLQ